MRVAKRALALGMGVMIALSGCGGKKTVTADFDSATNQKIEHQELTFEVPKAWGESAEREGIMHFSWEGGKLIVCEIGNASVVKLSEEEAVLRDILVESFITDGEGTEGIETEYVEIGDNRWMINKGIFSISWEEDYIGEQFAVIDGHRTSYGFYILTEKEEGLDFSRDFNKILETVQVSEEINYNKMFSDLFDSGISVKDGVFDISLKDLEGVMNSAIGATLGHNVSFIPIGEMKNGGYGYMFAPKGNSNNHVFVATNGEDGKVSGVAIQAEADVFDEEMATYVALFLKFFFPDETVEEVAIDLNIGSKVDKDLDMHLGTEATIGHIIEEGIESLTILPKKGK